MSLSLALILTAEIHGLRENHQRKSSVFQNILLDQQIDNTRNRNPLSSEWVVSQLEHAIYLNLLVE